MLLIQADARALPLSSESVHCVVTSPPYFNLRNYKVDGQIGLEKTPEAFIAELVAVFREVKRVLRKDGTCWVNIGDSFAANGSSGSQGKTGQRADRTFTASGIPKSIPSGLKNKDLIGIPWRLAFALQAEGWYLRADCIWHKPNPMPSSVLDRPTIAHEYVFLLTKSARYYYDQDAVREKTGSEASPEEYLRALGSNGGADSDRFGKGYQKRSATLTHPLGRNRRSVWTIPTEASGWEHYATFPMALVEPCILAGCPKGGTVLDLFAGIFTGALVARKHDRNFIGVELNPKSLNIARARLAGADDVSEDGKPVFDQPRLNFDTTNDAA